VRYQWQLVCCHIGSHCSRPIRETNGLATKCVCPWRLRSLQGTPDDPQGSSGVGWGTGACFATTAGGWGPSPCGRGTVRRCTQRPRSAGPSRRGRGGLPPFPELVPRRGPSWASPPFRSRACPCEDPGGRALAPNPSSRIRHSPRGLLIVYQCGIREDGENRPVRADLTLALCAEAAEIQSSQRSVRARRGPCRSARRPCTKPHSGAGCPQVLNPGPGISAISITLITPRTLRKSPSPPRTSKPTGWSVSRIRGFFCEVCIMTTRR
jgi:hypothetical protein